jgi:hypothetical protein
VGTLTSQLQTLAARLIHAPRVYVDANLPAGCVSTMRLELGWDVLFVIEDPTLRRAADRDHFARALDLGRTLITLDRDFLDDRRFPLALSPGLIVCSAPDEAGLVRIFRYVDRVLLGAARDTVLPLRGRTIELTPDLVLAD